MAVYLASFNGAPNKPAQAARAAQLESRDRHPGGLGIAARRAALSKAPARSAMRSAARRCSAAGRPWR